VRNTGLYKKYHITYKKVLKEAKKRDNDRYIEKETKKW
jgi:hypothetical protein